MIILCHFFAPQFQSPPFSPTLSSDNHGCLLLCRLRRRMDSSDICCSECDKCCNEDHLCERCASDRGNNPNCGHCEKGCSKCKNVGDGGLDHANNDIGFDKCKCESCPMNTTFEEANRCSDCFEELAKKYGCVDGCKVWVVAECGHTTCTAFQASEDTPENECPEPETWSCKGGWKKGRAKNQETAVNRDERKRKRNVARVGGWSSWGV